MANTSNHGWEIPDVGGDKDVWGQILNDFFDGELDEQVKLEGTFANRPAAGQDTVKYYHATDQRIVYYNDGSSWEAVYGLGTDSNPVPGTSHFESVSTKSATNKVVDNKVQAGHPDFANPNEALDFANSNGYDKIEIPPGDYTDKFLKPYDGQTVIGHNAQSVIFKQIDNANGSVNWTIRRIGFDNGGDQQDPLRSYGAGCSFENCIVFNTGRRGVNVGADQTSVKNVRIPNSTPNDGIEIFGANCSVEGCVVNGTIVDSGTNNSVGDGNVTY